MPGGGAAGAGEGGNNHSGDPDESDAEGFFSQLMSQPTAAAESRFTQEELSKVKKEFDKLSKD